MNPEQIIKTMDLYNKYNPEENKDKREQIYEDYLLLLLYREKATVKKLSDKEFEVKLNQIEQILEAPNQMIKKIEEQKG